MLRNKIVFKVDAIDTEEEKSINGTLTYHIDEEAFVVGTSKGKANTIELLNSTITNNSAIVPIYVDIYDEITLINENLNTHANQVNKVMDSIEAIDKTFTPEYRNKNVKRLVLKKDKNVIHYA